MALIEIFEPPNLWGSSKVGKDLRNSEWNAASEIKRMLGQIRAHKDQPLKNLRPPLKERCRELLNLPDLPKNKSLKEKYDSLNVE